MVPSGKTSCLFLCFYKSIVLGTCIPGFNTLIPSEKKNNIYIYTTFCPCLFIYVPCIYDALRCLIMVNEKKKKKELLMKRIEQQGID